MISLKAFVSALHDALKGASDSLMDANTALLDKYFIESSNQTQGIQNDEFVNKSTLTPRTVLLEYPRQNAAGELENIEVAVPLITLVPLSMAKIERAKFTTSFEMEVVENELLLNFTNDKSLFKKKPKVGTLEISLTPQDTPEGLRLLVEGYEAILRRQIS